MLFRSARKRRDGAHSVSAHGATRRPRSRSFSHSTMIWSATSTPHFLLLLLQRGRVPACVHTLRGRVKRHKGQTSAPLDIDCLSQRHSPSMSHSIAWKSHPSREPVCPVPGRKKILPPGFPVIIFPDEMTAACVSETTIPYVLQRPS